VSTYLEFGHESTLEQLVFALQRRLGAALFMSQSVEPQKVDAQAVDLSLDVGRLGHLPADLRLDAQLLLRQNRVLVRHHFHLRRLPVVLLTQPHLQPIVIHFCAEQCPFISRTSQQRLPRNTLSRPRPRKLRSTDTRTLLVSRTRTNFGDRAFSAAGPRVCHYLPTDLRQSYLSYSCFGQ